MGWQPTAYSLLAFGAAGVSIAVATQIWSHRGERGAHLFIGLLLAAAGWSAAYALQLGFTTAAQQRVCQRLGVAIGGAIPTLWLLFAFTYSGHDRWLTPRVRAVLLAQPAVFGLLALTNPLHGLVWEQLPLVETTAGPILEQSFGAGMYLFLAASYLLILAGLGVLFYVFVRNPTIYRTQTALLMLGGIVPMSANMAFIAGFSWGPFPTLDPTPFTFVVTGALVGLAFFRFDLLTRAPVARRHVLGEMGDGMLVLDDGGRVVDTNDVTRQLLDGGALAGLPVTALFDDGERTEEVLDALDGRTLAATVDGGEQSYDVRCAELTDSSGESIGHVVSFRNVTDRNRYEQRLEVTQRVLRHNLRNEISVIRAHAEQLTRQGHSPEAEHIIETTERLIDLSEKTRLITRIDSHGETAAVPVDARERLFALCAEFREEYPAVTLDCAIPEEFTVAVQDGALFDIPVENVIENAIVHNDREEPRVQVAAERAGESVRVRVRDNGPPIPETEHAVLDTDAESPLRHGSSIGLWLAYWSVRTANGSISFDTGEAGNVVTLEFPAGEGGS